MQHCMLAKHIQYHPNNEPRALTFVNFEEKNLDNTVFYFNFFFKKPLKKLHYFRIFRVHNFQFNHMNVVFNNLGFFSTGETFVNLYVIDIKATICNCSYN